MPDTGIASIAEAMDQKWDDFFANQPRVSYTECLLGHIISAEGPQAPRILSSSMEGRSNIYEEGPLLWS